MKKLKLIVLSLPFVTMGQNINYSEDIAPIIYNKCLMCHHSGGIGPFSFETYSNTVSNIGMIQHVVSNGEMPPWPPDTNYQRYAYENILSSFEISEFLALCLDSFQSC